MSIRVLTATIALLALGCSPKEKADKRGPLVAKGKGVAVTADEFRAKLDEQPPMVRARYTTLERKKELIENLVRFELLAQEALAQKLDQDPEVRETLRKVLVQKLVRKAFDEKEAAAAVPEPEARKYYDEHLDEFQRPERLRLSLIALRAEKGATDRAKKGEAARKLYARLKSEGQKNPVLFSSLARDASEDAGSRAGGGDLGYRTREELEQQWSKEVAAAAFALKDPGQESAVVESPQGFFLLKLGARQPGMSRSFEEVKPQLLARVGREKRTRDFDEYVKELRAKAGVEIVDAELEKIAVSVPPVPPTPAQGPLGPQGGAGSAAGQSGVMR